MEHILAIWAMDAFFGGTFYVKRSILFAYTPNSDAIFDCFK